jgi:hypothetical protein
MAKPIHAEGNSFCFFLYVYLSSHLVRLDLSGNRLHSPFCPTAHAAGHILCPERQSMQNALFGAISPKALSLWLFIGFISL